jgi:hypothetical protein
MPPDSIPDAAVTETAAARRVLDRLWRRGTDFLGCRSLTQLMAPPRMA